VSCGQPECHAFLKGGDVLQEIFQDGRYAGGLGELWFFRGGDDMAVELTSEEITEIGKMWGEVFLSSLSVEERLAGLKPEERWLAGLKPEEVERYLHTLKEKSADIREDT
jgi:hypothetical protein